MHVMQKASRQMNMAANAPPPAAPMMMYRSSLLSMTLPGAVASLVAIKKAESNIKLRSKVQLYNRKATDAYIH